MRHGHQRDRSGFRLGHDSRWKRAQRLLALPEHRLVDGQPPDPGCQLVLKNRVDRVGAERRAGWGDEADGCTACEERERTAELMSELLSERRFDLQVIHRYHIRCASSLTQVAVREFATT